MFTGDIRRDTVTSAVAYRRTLSGIQQVIAPGAARRYAPADGSSTRGGSTSVRGQVRSPHMAKLQAASVPIASGSRAMGQTDRGIA